MSGGMQRGLLFAVLGLALAAPQAHARVGVETVPPLSPGFTKGATDYVTSCAEGSVAVSARATGNDRISIDGGPPESGRFKGEVPLQEGQSFEVLIEGRSGERRHFIRCLPEAYPDYGFTRRGEPAASQYAFSPAIGIAAGVPGFAAIFDEHGAPIWWLPVNRSIPADAQILSDGNFAFGHVPFLRGDSDGYEIRGLDGSRLAELHTELGRTDTHELLERPDGGYVLLSNPIVTGVDLTPYGGPEDAAIFDAAIEEFDADGELVSSWSAFEHVGLEEARDWWPLTIALPEQVEGVGPVYNAFHVNSLEPSGRGYLISLRRTNAVYRIGGGGSLAWKLGGTKTPERLRLRGDELAPKTFGGQHDARIRSDGTVTVLDNGTNENRPPRALRFEINAAKGKAKLLESQTEENVELSTCCGSVREVGDSQVVAWGAEYAAEYGDGGRRTWQLRTPGIRSYRVVPVEPGRVSDAELRAGMDAMSPRRPSECTSEAELVPGRGSATPGDDELRGRRDEAEYFRGLAGDDRIDARAGDDCVLGDGGGDRIEGGPGDDELIGGAGPDRIEGGRGADVISCGRGKDLAIAKGGDEIADNCERVRRAGAKKPGKPGADGSQSL